MFELAANPLAVTVISFALSVVLTFFVRSFARNRGIVAKAKSDRWHKKPTAMMGGIAIFLTTVVVDASVVPKTPES